MKVDYNKIYKYLETYSRRTITASQLAYGTGQEKIHGATMMKLVRENKLEAAPNKGFYYVIK